MTPLLEKQLMRNIRRCVNLEEISSFTLQFIVFFDGLRDIITLYHIYQEWKSILYNSTEKQKPVVKQNKLAGMFEF